MKKLNEKTMCYEYLNGEVSETFEESISRKLLEDKWRMKNEKREVNILKMVKELSK